MLDSCRQLQANDLSPCSLQSIQIFGINNLGYDVAFQREIVDKQKSWPEIKAAIEKEKAARNLKGKPGKGKRKSQKSHPKRPAPRRRKHVKEEELSDDDVMDIDDAEAIRYREESEREDDDDDEMVEAIYTPRGTRSRPGR